MERKVGAIQKIKEQAELEIRELTALENFAVDRHFRALMELLGTQIYHFTRVYGLMDMQDDARQACAISVHRAIAAYDLAKARFTTFVMWQLRGEPSPLKRDIVNSLLFENSPGDFTSNLTKERALQGACLVLRQCAGSEPSREIKALA
jgi:hypothetical protein